MGCAEPDHGGVNAGLMWARDWLELCSVRCIFISVSGPGRWGPADSLREQDDRANIAYALASLLQGYPVVYNHIRQAGVAQW
jgi:hypothetical protein